MAQRIKYYTICYYCRKMIGPGKAWLQRVDKEWWCQCDDCYERRHKTPDKGQTPRGMKGESMGLSVTVTVKDGATNKDIAAALRHQAGLIEGLPPKVASSRENTDTPPKGKKVKTPVELEEEGDFETANEEEEATFDGDDTEEVEEEAEEETVKLTHRDIVEALQAYQKVKGRDKAIAAVKKFAKSGSAKEVKPADYPKLLKLIRI